MATLINSYRFGVTKSLELVTAATLFSATNAVNITNEAENDLALAFALRWTTPQNDPTTVANWATVVTRASGTINFSAAYSRIVPSGLLTSFTEPNATHTGVMVLRPTGGTMGTGGTGTGASGSTTLTTPAITMTNTDGTSWIYGVLNTQVGQGGITLPASLEQVGTALDGASTRRAIFVRSPTAVSAFAGGDTITLVNSGNMTLLLAEITVS